MLLLCCTSDLLVGWNVYSKQQRKYFIWDNNHNGHPNNLGLSLYICQKIFLQRPILLLMQSLICSNTLPLSPSLLSCSLPTTFCWVFNPVVSNNNHHWINTFGKELFSFLKVTPTRNCVTWEFQVYIILLWTECHSIETDIKNSYYTIFVLVWKQKLDLICKLEISMPQLPIRQLLKKAFLVLITHI